MMRAVLVSMLLLTTLGAHAQVVRDTSSTGYAFSRPPLFKTFYATLPLGNVEPRGWLREQLRRAADGMTGHLDELYPLVGEDNAWRGGDGDSWERGPYWLDGLVPLAYILDDAELIEKARPYIEWTLESQEPSGFFGPSSVASEGGEGARIQRTRSADWWPRMVMLKVLRSYYEATGDARVIDFMTAYFRYQLEMLPETPLDHWSNWAAARGGDNQESIYWLYNRTGDEFLLDVAQIVFEQTQNWTDDLRSGKTYEDYWYTHVVNVAMGIKQPAVQYLQAKDPRYLDAVRTGLDALMEEHGQVHGLFSGDENLHGTDPTHGTELCSVVEFMYSLERLMKITGDVAYIDQLEKVAYNALPTHIADDYGTRQYYQQANQVRISLAPRNFIEIHDNTDLCYGILTGYPCCTTNLHQGWPKLVHNLWLATRDGGLAALLYGPSDVTARVAGGIEVRVREETSYPFEETIRFVIETERPATFPLHLRIPAWANDARITVNGDPLDASSSDAVARIERTWNDGDVVTLELPMAVATNRGRERAVSVTRGPLVYAVAVPGRWQQKAMPNPEMRGEKGWEVHPEADWNYGLLIEPDQPSASFQVERRPMTDYPWTPEAAPIRLVATGRRIPWWTEYNETAGPLPHSPVESDEPLEEVVLLPYGATTLRVGLIPTLED